MMLHETIRNDDFKRNTALQPCCNIVSNSYNIVPTWQRRVDMLCHVTGLEDTPYNHGSMFKTTPALAWSGA